MKHFRINLEERADGQTAIEEELTFYASLDSAAPLLKANHIEHQEQWQIKIPKSEDNITGGRMRVRKTTQVSDGEVTYVMTIKIKSENGEKETPTPISSDYFDQFSLMATEGMKKTRYDIPIPGREEIWEVDVFYLPDGKKANWVKIDFEFKSDNREVPPLPEGFMSVIPGNTTNPEEQEFIRKLYSELFLTTKTK